MTNAELIAKLQTYDPNLPVEFLVQDDDSEGKSTTVKGVLCPDYPFEEMCGTLTLTLEINADYWIVRNK